jgi:protein SCO1
VAANQLFVYRYPVAAKRAVRALLKATDRSAVDAERAARATVKKELKSQVRSIWRVRNVAILIALLTVIRLTVGDAGGENLPKIGRAPAFTLTNQDGQRASLSELRGKVVALTFIYTTCVDSCPLLTATMASLQGRLGDDFGTQVQFLSITVDPVRDTPAVLKSYAERHGANRAGWAFLTGTPSEIQVVAKHYGVYYRKTSRGDVDHTFLTSVVDGDGILRVQYTGVHFDPTELLRDLQALVREAHRR